MGYNQLLNSLSMSKSLLEKNGIFYTSRTSCTNHVSLIFEVYQKEYYILLLNKMSMDVEIIYSEKEVDSWISSILDGEFKQLKHSLWIPVQSKPVVTRFVEYRNGVDVDFTFLDFQGNAEMYRFCQPLDSWVQFVARSFSSSPTTSLTYGNVVVWEDDGDNMGQNDGLEGELKSNIKVGVFWFVWSEKLLEESLSPPIIVSRTRQCRIYAPIGSGSELGNGMRVEMGFISTLFEVRLI